MALPKHRQSRSRSRMRRSHDALTGPNVVSCSACGEPKLPHRLCGGCGTYKGRTVVKFEEEELTQE
ncbi:MAG: 50S ribosomal protein L32 [Thermodesulfobacteriota bacterium]